MALIDYHRITVDKDSDGKDQSYLDKVFNTDITGYYTSDSGSRKATKSVSIYFRLDKPMYISSFDFDSSVASSDGSGYQMYLYAYSNENYNSGYVNLGGCSVTDWSVGRGPVTYNIDKTKIKKYQYFALSVSQGCDDSYYKNTAYVKVKHVRLYAEDSMPKYILKDSNENYYCKVKDDMIAYNKDNIVEDNLMDDINTITKDNLGLMNGNYRVLRILVP